jgi:Arc/MetJ-type ribon-helix-helix transcriptional regulator/ElaB/YqjD/DUF883 family membrane-anchored ribosome-binding protein
MIKEETWRNALEKSLEDFKAKIQIIEQELEKIERELETRSIQEPSELFSRITALRRELKTYYSVFKREIEAVFSSAKTEAREMPQEEAEELIEDLDDMVDELMETAEDLVEDLSDRLEDLKEKVKESWKKTLREMRKEITVEKSLEAPPGSLRPRTPSVVISSVRLPEADLKVIDSLVEAGIFRSRNEAIAFFVHRGIEASKDWLEKINSTLENIRKLQEEAKREIMSLLDESSEKIEANR